VLLPKVGAGEFAGEHAHLVCQNHALFSGHGAVNRVLDGLRLGSCVADGHGKILSGRPKPATTKDTKVHEGNPKRHSMDSREPP
jgi:hypothetical protein